MFNTTMRVAIRSQMGNSIYQRNGLVTIRLYDRKWEIVFIIETIRLGFSIIIRRIRFKDFHIRRKKAQ